MYRYWITALKFLSVGLVALTSISASAQSDGRDSTGGNGAPVYNVGIPSTASIDARLSVAASRVPTVGVTKTFSFWIKFTDGKFEQGEYNVKTAQLSTSGTVVNSTGGTTAGGGGVNLACNAAPTITIQGHWRYFETVSEGVVGDHGWDYIIDGITTDPGPGCGGTFYA